ncbi:MAG: M48 family metallopeptidase [Candidatus Melainabacteria bacterium]
MIAYTPQLPDDEANVSRDHPLGELGKLIAGSLLSLLLLYYLLGIAVDLGVRYAPDQIDHWFAGWHPCAKSAGTSNPQQKRVNRILSRLTGNLPPGSPAYCVDVSPDKDINAFALPGGHIQFNQGLLRLADSDEEVAYVLGHELGHFAHRDHLRSMGRGLLLGLLAGAAGIGSQDLGNMTAGILNLSERQFSRDQEAAADAFGLDLLSQTYGGVDGAIRFHQHLLALRDDPVTRALSFAATHPSDEERLAKIRTMIRRKGYRLSGESQPGRP